MPAPSTPSASDNWAGAAGVVLFHHKPDRTDDELDDLARCFESAPLPVTVAAEGMVFEL